MPDTLAISIMQNNESLKIVVPCARTATKSPTRALHGQRTAYAQDAVIQCAVFATWGGKLLVDWTMVQMPPRTAQMRGCGWDSDELKMHIGNIDPTFRAERAVPMADYGSGAYFLLVLNYIVEIVRHVAGLDVALVLLVVFVIRVPLAHAHTAARREYFTYATLTFTKYVLVHFIIRDETLLPARTVAHDVLSVIMLAGPPVEVLVVHADHGEPPLGEVNILVEQE